MHFFATLSSSLTIWRLARAIETAS
ncbi:hypothetical protein AGR1A_Cc20221 [Agrobacterium fabacearum CFBP 5771]|nr:hypothetical protein AGR1A_Cc20221 [Agrobacterium fabacearum CFBP 5771]